MRVEERRQLGLLVILAFPIMGWLAAVKKTETITSPKIVSLWHLAKQTPEKPVLISTLIIGLLIGIALAWLIGYLARSEYEGASYRKFLRGARIASTSDLARKTHERKTDQVDLVGVPLPLKLEPLHVLIAGATGAGKSVAMRRLAFSALCRGDRMIVLDPNGDMLSKFYREGDVILNPYDDRSLGWSLFNEVRNEYDFKKLSLSIVPRGQTKDAEEWAAYARLLLSECWKKLDSLGRRDINELFKLTTLADPKDLKRFLTGTAAEALFVGADKALASARFVLSAHLPEHLNMPAGDFSLRDWLDDPKGGNLYIPWNEAQAESLKPLISAWCDVLCSSVLSLPISKSRRLWLFIDELASMEKLASLEPALTKGRKHGLRVVAGLQAVSQLIEIYGEHSATTLRSCFRNLVVFACSVTDPKTAEDMSKSLGTHEVERDKYGKSSNSKSTNKSQNEEHKEERVVLPSQLTNLPDLEGYVALAQDLPIARFKVEPQTFKERVPAFVERCY